MFYSDRLVVSFDPYNRLSQAAGGVTTGTVRPLSDSIVVQKIPKEGKEMDRGDWEDDIGDSADEAEQL